MKVKCIFFLGRTPAKITVSWRKKKGNRTGVIAVWYVCPYCCCFQRNRGEEPWPCPRVQQQGAVWGATHMGCVLGGNFCLLQHSGMEVHSPEGWVSQHSTIRMGQGAGQRVCSESTFQREQWSHSHSAATGLQELVVTVLLHSPSPCLKHGLLPAWRSRNSLSP